MLVAHWFYSFNTIQNYIDLKHSNNWRDACDCFNTIQNYIDLKQANIEYYFVLVLIPFKIT